MTFIRRFFLTFAVIFLFLTLLTVNTIWTVNSTVTNRETVKSWLEDSGFYDNVIGEIASLVEEEVQKDSQNTKGELDTQLLVNAAQRVFTPENIQDKTELVLDAAYDWLESENNDLVFVIQLDDEKASLARNLVDEVNKRLSGLPECTPEQLIRAGIEIDLFTVDCNPPGVAELSNDFYDEFVASNDFLPDARFESSELVVDVNGVETPITQAYSDVPGWYSFARTTVWYVVVTALVWSLLVLFLSKNLRYGIRNLSIVFTVAAVLTLASVVSANLAVKSITFEGGGDSDVAETLIRPLVEEVASSALSYGYLFALIYISLSVAGFTYLFLTKQKKDQKDSENSDELPTKPPENNPNPTADNDKTSIAKAQPELKPETSSSKDKSETKSTQDKLKAKKD